ncbi:MAG: OmpA family protein [Deltaproteobacteria bacterium]|nr:OmpA family protein [Deltaproteobacteria bacterium]MCW5807078.1 OmpA family protein [Deltaproteobacteria bacterium]
MRAGLAAIVVVLVATGCAGSAVRTQTAATAALIATARDNGAQRCAPVELAMAESHNDFASHALDEGNYHDAVRDAAVAKKNAEAAIEKSPREKCADPTSRVVVVPRPGDADGDGILDPDDKCPNEPEDKDGFEDEDGCPDDDNDHDGIADKIDACPNEPEDRDGFEDDDGCPELDNDKDGLADSIDVCPNEPEDKDGFEDDDGCPDPDNDKDGILDKDDKCPLEFGVAPDGCPKKYTLVVVTEKKIELKQTVFFDTNKATIKAQSFALLDDVALAMRDNPKIKVEVQGHTDSVGDAAFNLRLSQWRADSVKKYLVGKGIAADRMSAKGFGQGDPIADNRTDQGRAQNRRVEFIITAR